jgi:hypothetical protein
MNLKDLTVEERAALIAELEAERTAELARVQEERDAFKALKDEAVRDMFALLSETSAQILERKNTVFDRFGTIRTLKDELFKTRSNRQSDTYTTEDGRITIKLGNRMYDGWDDTVEVGIRKVKDYLATLARDENSANLIEVIMGLLARDKQGNLKASRVLELERLGERTGDPDLIDGIAIIRRSYRPSPSCQFIEVKYKDGTGREKSLPLSISAFDVE